MRAGVAMLALSTIARSFSPAVKRSGGAPLLLRGLSTARDVLFDQTGAIDARLETLGYELPPVPSPKGSYVLTSRLGNVLHLCGHIPVTPDGELLTGKVGKDLSDDEGQAAAKVVGLNIIATLKNEVGLDNVVKIHKLVGFVNCVDGFANQPYVVNGCSDLMFEVFGDRGIHARSAVGTNALPLNIPVEIEAIVEVQPGA